MTPATPFCVALLSVTLCHGARKLGAPTGLHRKYHAANRSTMTVLGRSFGAVRSWRLWLVFLAVAVMAIPTPSFLVVSAGATHAVPSSEHAVAGSSSVLASLPSGRASEGLAYDYADGYLLMFGGSEPGQIYLNDTWEFSGGHWTQLHPVNSPPARDLIQGQMAWDPFDGYVLLFSGRGASNLTDTWYWQAGNWHEVCASCAPAVQQGATVADSKDGYMLEIAGQREYPSYSDVASYWSYRAGTWTDLGVAPFPARQNMAAFYDPVAGEVVAFGGFVYNGGTGFCYGTSPYCRDTWSFFGGSWTEVCTGGLASPSCATTPPALEGGEGAWDPTDGYGLLWGGQNMSTGNTNASWAWNAGAWTALPLLGQRPPSSADAIAFDAAGNDRSMATFGGSTPWQTWVWRHGGWSTPYALEGRVTNVSTGMPIAGANITDGSLYAISNSTGAYSLTEVNGSYALQASATGYASSTVSAAVSGADLVINFALGAPGATSLVAAAGASPSAGPVPLAVAFTGLASGGTAPYTYAWRFGDGGSSSSQDPANTFRSAGAYLVRLWVNDSASHSATAQVTVTATAPPALSASASASPTSGFAPLGVQFSGAGSGGQQPYTFAWNFGDGTHALSQNPYHTYTTAGTYSAELWVNDSASGSSHATTTVTALQVSPLSVTVTASPTSGVAPLSVGFTASASGGVAPYTFSWNFGDLSMGSGAIAAHVYTTSGSYSATVTVQDSQGSVATSTATTITVLGATTGGPPIRNTEGLAYDYADGYLLLFGGGQSGQIYLNDTWAFSGGHWTQLHPAHSPPARDFINGQMLWDPFDGYVLLFGGRGSTNLTDTWYWQGGDWHEVCSSCGPAVQQGLAVADLADGYVLEVSGQREYPSYSDEAAYWSYLGGTWTNLGVAPFPARQNMGGFYDPQSREVVAFGGYDYSGTMICTQDQRGCGDTWSYTGGVWTELCTGGSSPPSCAQSPPAVLGPESAWDPFDGYGLMWGGQNATTGVSSNAAWTWTSSGWQLLPSSSNRNGECCNAVAYDANTNDMSLVSYSNTDTWVWRNGAWYLAHAIFGTVTSASTGAPIAGANVTDGTRYTLTNASGDYALTEVDSAYGITASVGGYLPSSSSVTVAGYAVELNFSLSQGGTSLTATAAASPSAGSAPLTVSFVGVGSGGVLPYTYAWRFGDGGASAVASPTHIYLVKGTYVARLWVNDSGGRSASAMVSIYATSAGPLTAVASATPTTGTLPLRVLFSGVAAGGTAPYDFYWNFGDGSVGSAAESPSHTFNSSGTFQVELTVTDAGGAVARSSVQIVVNGSERVPVAQSGITQTTVILTLSAVAIVGVLAAATVLWRRRVNNLRGGGSASGGTPGGGTATGSTGYAEYELPRGPMSPPPYAPGAPPQPPTGPGGRGGPANASQSDNLRELL